MEEITLSVIIPTYNHEKYIRQTLDSVIMQKTRYSFEVLVGEDCSTDGTRDILRQYEEKYPGFFTMYYRDHNMHYDEIDNIEDLLSKAKGKYIIILEGDDYWIDSNKIERQITFLEEHKEYYAIAHNCVVVNENSEQTGEKYPECKEKEYTYRHYFSEILPGQTATIMYRNYLTDSAFRSDYPKIPRGIPGDRIIYYMLIVNGRVFCLQESLSAYRHIKNTGSSFSATNRFDFRRDEQAIKAMQIYTEKNKPEWIGHVNVVYILLLWNAYKNKSVSFKTVVEIFAKEKLWKSIGLLMTRVFRHRILRKEVWIA